MSSTLESDMHFVLRVIKSCTTQKHLDVTENLVHLFNKKHNIALGDSLNWDYFHAKITLAKALKLKKLESNSHTNFNKTCTKYRRIIPISLF